MRAIQQQHEAMFVWWAALVECWSALERKTRAGRLIGEQRRLTELRLHNLARSWTEIHPAPLLRDRAVRLLAVHDLRAADALQLAAALTWAEERPRGHAFVCLDDRLREAARREGFLVLPEEAI
jgi:uncharacterized protein